MTIPVTTEAEPPAVERDHGEAVDAPVYKRAMRRHASGTTLVTTGRSPELFAATATAVCSASIEPPLLLVVLARTGRTHRAISRFRTFAVNLLGQDQGAVATYFATSAEKSFAEIPHRIGRSGCPLIENGLVGLECTLHATHDVSTHSVFVGKVIAVTMMEARGPLVHFEGDFRTLCE